MLLLNVNGHQRLDGIENKYKNSSNCSNLCEHNKYKPNFEFNFTPTSGEVEQIIQSVTSTSVGSDGFNAYMLQLAISIISSYLWHIINYCLSTGVFPEVWKKAVLSHLLKLKILAANLILERSVYLILLAKL